MKPALFAAALSVVLLITALLGVWLLRNNGTLGGAWLFFCGITIPALVLSTMFTSID